MVRSVLFRESHSGHSYASGIKVQARHMNEKVERGVVLTVLVQTMTADVDGFCEFTPVETCSRKQSQCVKIRRSTIRRGRQNCAGTSVRGAIPSIVAWPRMAYRESEARRSLGSPAKLLLPDNEFD